MGKPAEVIEIVCTVVLMHGEGKRAAVHRLPRFVMRNETGLALFKPERNGVILNRLPAIAMALHRENGSPDNGFDRC